MKRLLSDDVREWKTEFAQTISSTRWRRRRRDTGQYVPSVSDSGDVLIEGWQPKARVATEMDKLAAAVMCDVMHRAQAWGAQPAEIRRELDEYMTSDNVTWPLSFLNICSMFDVDPEAARAAYAACRGEAGKPRRRIINRVSAGRMTIRGAML